MTTFTLRPSIERRRCTACFWTALLVLLQQVCMPAVAAPKTDVVVLRNGDRLTGEIKALERGQLRFKTDSLGTVYIEWDKLASVQTDQYLDVETSSGRRYFGRVPHSGDAGVMTVAPGETAVPRLLEMSDVVRIQPIDQGEFLERLDGSLSVGFNYAKANNETQFNLSGDVGSRNEVRAWSIDGTTTINSQTEGRSTSMYDVTVAHRRFLGNRWFLPTFATVQGNEQLGLNIRAVAGGGIGRFLLQDPDREWAAFTGLAYARENFEDENPRNSIEAIVGTQFSFFVYDTPKRSLDAGLVLFPSLTESGRVRGQADVTSRFEVVNDLFFDLSLYYSYDSDPGETAQSNSDYGVVTSLGYSF